MRSVVDWLASVLLSAAIFDPGSDEALAVHQLMRAWKRRRYSETGSAEDGSPRLSDNAFLVAYDLPYGMRRLDFLAQKLKELTGPGAERAFRGAGIDLPRGDPAADGQSYAAMRQAINAARKELADADRTLVSEVTLRVQALALTTEHLKDILAGDGDAAMLETASAIADSRIIGLDMLAAAIAKRVAIASDKARQRLAAAFPTNATPLGAALRVFYETFEAYDVALFPLVFGTDLGEANPVDIVRISPLDARGPLQRPRERLKGAGLHRSEPSLTRSGAATTWCGAVWTPQNA